MSNNRILPIFGGGGPSPSNYYTKAEIDAMLQNYAQLATTDLANYYLKTETYTQQEIQNLIGQITSFEVVATLPVSDIKTNVIYLLGPTGTGADKYEEWIYSNSAWVKIGETSVDLSNYVTVNQLNTALGFYTTTLDLNTLLAGKQDVLTPGTGITIGTDNVISAAGGDTEEIEHAIAAAINDTRDTINQDLHNNYVKTQTMNDQLKNYAPKAALDAYSSKAYVDTAIGSVYAEIEDKERATSFALNDLEANKQDILTPGTGITIGTDNVISADVPTVGTGVITLTSNGDTIGTFGLNDSSNKTIDIPQGGGSSSNEWYGSQAEFDALGTNLDTNTNYYINEIDWTEIANRPTVPTKTSELTNDSGYVTDDLVNFRLRHPDEKAIMKIVNAHNVYLTQAEYDQLGTNIDPDTNYHIEGDEQTLSLTFTLADQSTVTYDVYVSPAQ